MRRAAFFLLALLVLGLPSAAAECLGCISGPCGDGESPALAPHQAPAQAPGQDGTGAAEAAAELPPCHAAMIAAAQRAPAATAPSAPDCHDEGGVDLSCCADGTAMPAAHTASGGLDWLQADLGPVQGSQRLPETRARRTCDLPPLARPPSAIYLLNAAWLI